jgi:hypothetical protein
MNCHTRSASQTVLLPACATTRSEAPQHTDWISLGALPRLVAFNGIALFPSSQHPKQLLARVLPPFYPPRAAHQPPHSTIPRGSGAHRTPLHLTELLATSYQTSKYFTVQYLDRSIEQGSILRFVFPKRGFHWYATQGIVTKYVNLTGIFSCLSY